MPILISPLRAQAMSAQLDCFVGSQRRRDAHEGEILVERFKVDFFANVGIRNRR